MANYLLGLDLGTSSIGWSLVEMEEDLPVGLLGAGVRVFPEGVDRDTKGLEKSKNETRRTARGGRRIKSRRRKRRLRLVSILKKAGMWPKNPEEFQSLYGPYLPDKDNKTNKAYNPYELRTRALDEQISPSELGRVFYHLNQRRGFKSNRKSGGGKEDGKVLTETTALQNQIEENRCRTLGEYLCLIKDDPEKRLRGRYTLRKMYEEEFEKIWKAQSRYFPQILTDALEKELKDETIFFQRPLKPTTELIGECEFEPGEKRCPRADWYAQRFRILQDVNNMMVQQPDGMMEPLTKEQRGTLISKLNSKTSVTFDQMRQAIGLIESQTFNFEEGKRKSLKGNTMEYGLSKKAVFGKRWAQIDPDLRERIYEQILEVDDPEELRAIAEEEWELQDAQIDALLKIDLPDGYMNLSQKAIRKLTPFMEQGEKYPEAVQSAGYLREDQRPKESLDQLPHPPDVRNPIVQKALFETRKVVNALVKAYGKPARIVVELARDAKGSREDRKKVTLKMREREQERETVRDKLMQEFNIGRPSRDDIDRYRLWEEASQRCPYTGKIIPRHLLFSPDVEVDHILPYSRSLDNSYMNKTVCYTAANRDKRNQTPYEWLSGDPEKYETMLQTLGKFTGEAAWRKRRKFTQKTVEIDECIARQLNDTRYISREVRGFLQKLGVPVTGSKGQVTAELRHQWGLNSILDHSGADVKNRDDHRHHAVDATVIALTGPRHLQKLSRTKGQLAEPLPAPWEDFRDQVSDKINAIKVSHRVTRKIAGALHEETSYGKTDKPDEYVYRKALTDLKGPMVAKIRDKNIRELVRNRLKDKGHDPDNPPNIIPKEVFAEPLILPPRDPGKKGVPVKKVRITDTFTNLIPLKDREGNPYRYVAPGSNHHIEIFEYKNKQGKTKRDGVVVSMFEAAQRVKNGEALIQQNHGPDKRFVMSLSPNEMFMLKLDNEKESLHRIQKIDVNKNISLRPHIYAGQVKDSDKPPLIQRKRPSTLEGFKVTVDPLGRIHKAND